MTAHAPVLERGVNARSTPTTADQPTSERPASRTGRTSGYDATATALMAARPRAIRRAANLLDGDMTAAADLVDDVLARLWERAHVRGETYGAGYVARAVDNAVVDRWRSRRRTADRVHLLADALPAVPTETHALDRVEAEHLLHRLSPEQRQLLHLRYLLGMTQAQTAARLEVPFGTIKSRTARALLQARPSPHRDEAASYQRPAPEGEGTP